MVGLVGPNGAGKSTLLKVMSGSLKAQAGTITYLGTEITKTPVHWRAKQGISMLMSGGQIFSSMSVSENIRFARSLANTARLSSAATRFDVFELFPDLYRHAKKRAGLLSGGERQMLALALVLSQTPRVLLLDEPTEGLVQDFALSVLHKISEYVLSTDAAALVVEHNTKILLETCSETHFMSQGAILATLSCEDPDVEDRLVELYFAS